MKEEKDIQPIDRLFRQSLEGYSPAPPASVWKKIRLQLAEKKSGRRVWLFGPGGISVISVILLVLSSWIIYKSFFAEPEISRQNTSVSAVVADSGVMPKPASEKNNITPGIQAKASSKPVPAADKKSGSSIIGGRKSPVNPQESSADHSVHQVDPLPHPSSNSKMLTMQKSPRENEHPESFGPGREAVQDIKNKQDAEIQFAEKNLLRKTTDTIDAFIERSADVIVTTGQETKKGNEPVSLPKDESVSGTDTLNTQDIPEPSKPKTKNRFAMAGIYGNIGQVYIKDRNPNLFYGGMITAGIWNNRWKAGIETGIGYSHYNDQGLYEFEFQRSDTVGYTGFTYFNPFDSSYLIVYKPNIIDTLIYFDTLPETSYSYLKIPLYFSKQLFRSGKFSLGMKTGPSVEFMIARTESQPEYLPEGSTLVKITNKSYTRLTTSWQWLVAPQLNWDITDKIVFRLEPSAVFYLNNMYDKNNRPSATPYGLSVTGGLIWLIK